MAAVPGQQAPPSRRKDAAEGPLRPVENSRRRSAGGERGGELSAIDSMASVLARPLPPGQTTGGGVGRAGQRRERPALRAAPAGCKSAAPRRALACCRATHLATARRSSGGGLEARCARDHARLRGVLEREPDTRNHLTAAHGGTCPRTAASSSQQAGGGCGEPFRHGWCLNGNGGVFHSESMVQPRLLIQPTNLKQQARRQDRQIAD